MRKLFLFALVVATLFTACKRGDEDNYSFTLSAQSVVEGERLDMIVSLVEGPVSGYGVKAEIDTYDAASGRTEETSFALLGPSGDVAGTTVDFPSSRRLDCYVDGMTAGTYLIRVWLSRGGCTSEKSIVVVIRKKSEGGGGGGGEDLVDVSVEAISFDGLELIGGVLVVEKGGSYRYPVKWTPSDANLLNFSAHSTNPDVVDVSISGFVLSVLPNAAGIADVVVSVNQGPEVVIPVLVKEREVVIDSFTIEGLQLADGRLLMEDNDEKRYPLSWKPRDANVLDFTAASSDDGIVEAGIDNNTLVVRAKYPGDATVTVATGSGVSQSFLVRVHKDVAVEVSWYEPAATDVQVRTKTFPCYLMFRSDSDKAFPEPITWTVTMKGVVGVTGKDTQSVTSKKDVKFYGNKAAQYDVVSNVLIPCYSIYRTDSFTLKLTLTLQRNDFFDPDHWSVGVKETYKDQDARVQQYITYIQQ